MQRHLRVPATISIVDERWISRALVLASKGYGGTSPNPLVGAILVRGSKLIGQGYHVRAGDPHAEVMAIRDAMRRGHRLVGATLYVTLEPCCTWGRTPPCTEAIRNAGIGKVVVGATDPNPAHRGRGLRVLRQAGIKVISGVLANVCERINEAFNYWIVHQRPWVVAKAAMTLDGKTATRDGESKWITGEESRAEGMRWRQGSDAILVGVNTVLADNPNLTIRPLQSEGSWAAKPVWRRIVLDSNARIPLNSKLVQESEQGLTTVITTKRAPLSRISKLSKKVEVWQAPELGGKPDLRWILKRLGAANITQLLVEGGSTVHGAFRDAGLVNRIVFFYAPRIMGGLESVRGVGGVGAHTWHQISKVSGIESVRCGDDLMLTGLVTPGRNRDR